jgi:hypothetical protein
MQYERFPISDIVNVDKRRGELGMPPLWYLREVYGIQPPENYPNKTQNSFN